MWSFRKLTALMVLAVALGGGGCETADQWVKGDVRRNLMKLEASNACKRCDLRGKP